MQGLGYENVQSVKMRQVRPTAAWRVFCKECGRGSSMHKTMSDIIKNATEQGFVVTDDNRVLCGDCYEKEKGNGE